MVDTDEKERVALFSRKLGGMLRAGVPLGDAFESLVVEEADAARRAWLEAMLVEIRAGRAPGEALAAVRSLEARGPWEPQDLEDIAQSGNEGARGEGGTPPGEDRLPESAGDVAREPGEVPEEALRILGSAWEKRATDVHLDPDAGGGRVRFRIDGRLVTQGTLDRTGFVQILEQMKGLACIDGGESVLPRDGRMRLKMGREENAEMLEARVGIDSSIHGESATLRLIRVDETRDLVRAPEVLFPEEAMRDAVLAAARRPHGLFLITGPVDAGKTTTGYSLLSLQDADAAKVITVEDPVEMVLPGVQQVQVKAAAGLTFAAALRGLLRRDPDVLYCAEVRDADTAWLLARAALTGHRVFTTLHASTADAAVTRLLDVGVERYVLADCLIAVLAQRLVRVLCTDCRQPDGTGATRLRSLGIEPADDGAVFTAGACPACHGTGYRGRRAIHELLPMTPELRRTMHDTAERAPLQRALEAARTGTLRRHGLELVARGITSLAELDRILPPD